MKALRLILEEMLAEPVQNVQQDIKPNGFCMLKPGFDKYTDEFIGLLGSHEWKVLRKLNKKLNLEDAKELYIMHKNEDFYNDLCDYMTSGKSLCLLCYKDCDDPIKDMNTIKDFVRLKWGKDKMHNAMHSSDSLKNVERESNLIFS